MRPFLLCLPLVAAAAVAAQAQKVDVGAGLYNYYCA